MPTLRTPELIGREAELDDLVAGLGLADAFGIPTTRAALIGGDAGIGKTRLLTELRDVAAGYGWQVVAGHCLDLADASLPYVAFSEVLGKLADQQPDAMGRVLEQHPTLARLLPGRRLRGAEPASALDPGGVLAALHALFGEIAAEAPVLVLVEDAHWADESTRDLLSYLLSRPLDAPVRLVVSFRSDDLHRRHPLRRQVGEWARLPGVDRVQLEPLGETATRRLIKALRPGTLSEAEYVSILTRSEGVPFFVEELVGASWDGPLPGELADVLLARLDRLDEVAQSVVRQASVAGRSVGHELLQATSDLGAEALDAGLRVAVESNVLEASRGGYAFRHALVAEAVYDDLLPGERTRLHLRIADAIRSGEARGTSAELARHARLAGDAATALAASVEAGAEAMSVGGASEAAEHYVEALDLLGALAAVPSGVDASDLVTRCADALVTAGRPGRAVKVLQAHLRELGETAPPERRGQLLTAIARAMAYTDTMESPAEVAAEAVELLRGGPAPLLARALAVEAECRDRWDVAGTRALAVEAMEIAQQHHLADLLIEIQTTLAGLGPEPGDAAEAWESIAQDARAASLPAAESRARYFRARLLLDRGELDRAIEGLREVLRMAEREGNPWAPYPAEARSILGAALIHQGHLDDAWQLLDVTGQDPPAVYEWMYFAQQMYLHLGLQGCQHGNALDRLLEHRHLDAQIALVSATTALLRAEYAVDPDAAVLAHDEAVEAISPLWHQWFQARLRLSTMALSVFCAAAPTQSADERLAAQEQVSRLMDEGARVIEFYAEYEQSRGAEYRAWVARRRAEHLRWRWLAQLDPPSAEDLVRAWRDAEGAFVEHGNVFELARTRLRLAQALKAARDPSAAHAMANLARPVAEALSARPLLAELRAVDGVRRRVPDEAQESVLTPRESEILDLVAQGRTNGEIGKQLFIATKTVSVHVSNILAKLVVSSRTEAVAVARQRGLL